MFLFPQPEICAMAIDTHPNATLLRRQHTRIYVITRRESFSSCSSSNRNIYRLLMYLIVDNVVAADSGNYTLNVTSVFIPRARRSVTVDMQVEVSTRGTLHYT